MLRPHPDVRSRRCGRRSTSRPAPRRRARRAHQQWRRSARRGRARPTSLCAATRGVLVWIVVSGRRWDTEQPGPLRTPHCCQFPEELGQLRPAVVVDEAGGGEPVHRRRDRRRSEGEVGCVLRRRQRRAGVSAEPVRDGEAAPPGDGLPGLHRLPDPWVGGDVDPDARGPDVQAAAPVEPRPAGVGQDGAAVRRGPLGDDEPRRATSDHQSTCTCPLPGAVGDRVDRQGVPHPVQRQRDGGRVGPRCGVVPRGDEGVHHGVDRHRSPCLTRSPHARHSLFGYTRMTNTEVGGCPPRCVGGPTLRPAWHRWWIGATRRTASSGSAAATRRGTSHGERPVGQRRAGLRQRPAVERRTGSDQSDSVERVCGSDPPWNVARGATSRTASSSARLPPWQRGCRLRQGLGHVGGSDLGALGALGGARSTPF